MNACCCYTEKNVHWLHSWPLTLVLKCLRCVFCIEPTAPPIWRLSSDAGLSRWRPHKAACRSLPQQNIPKPEDSVSVLMITTEQGTPDLHAESPTEAWQENSTAHSLISDFSLLGFFSVSIVTSVPPAHPDDGQPAHVFPLLEGRLWSQSGCRPSLSSCGACPRPQARPLHLLLCYHHVSLQTQGWCFLMRVLPQKRLRDGSLKMIKFYTGYLQLKK